MHGNKITMLSTIGWAEAVAVDIGGHSSFSKPLWKTHVGPCCLKRQNHWSQNPAKDAGDTLED